MAASFLIRAPLSTADDDASTSSSLSPTSASATSSAGGGGGDGFETASDPDDDVGPTPAGSVMRPPAAPVAVVLPRVVAQLTADDDDDVAVGSGDDSDQAFADADEEVEGPSGFFRVARVAPLEQNPVLAERGEGLLRQDELFDGLEPNYESAVSVSASETEHLGSSFGFSSNAGDKRGEGADLSAGSVSSVNLERDEGSWSNVDYFDTRGIARSDLGDVAGDLKVKEGVSEREAFAGVGDSRSVVGAGEEDAGHERVTDDSKVKDSTSEREAIVSVDDLHSLVNAREEGAVRKHVTDGSGAKYSTLEHEVFVDVDDLHLIVDSDGKESSHGYVTNDSMAKCSTVEHEVVSSIGDFHSVVDSSREQVSNDSEAKDSTPEHEVVVSIGDSHSVVDVGGEDADHECGTDDSEEEHETSEHKVVASVSDSHFLIDARGEGAACKYVTDDSKPYNSMSEHDVIMSADYSHPVIDFRGEDPSLNEVGGEADGVPFHETATVATLESTDVVEPTVKELEHNVPYSKGTRFGSDDLDEEEVDDDDEYEDEKEVDVFDYATLAELLRDANRSSAEGRITISLEDGGKVFSVNHPVGLGPTATSPQLAPLVAQTNISTPPKLVVAADPESKLTDEEEKLYKKVDLIRIKYLRLVHRLGHSPEHMIVAQVLYQLGLIEGFKRIRQATQASIIENAWKRTLQLEAEGKGDLDFSCNILVLGKTGVGKSATINSIFGEEKSETNAFKLATPSVKEIAGMVDGVELHVIDTPGLRASVMDQASNRKILSCVKKYTKRCRPDVVLYVDRMDTQRQDNNDLPLLSCITSSMGLSIWSNAIITLTHSAAALPEGPNGSPVNYEVSVVNRSRALQHAIRQAADDVRITNQVALVENHPACQRNREGEKVLPDGLIWRPQLLLLCYSLKMLSEINNLSKHADPIAPPNLFGLRIRAPPLPYFLSSLLQSRAHPKLANDHNIRNGDSDVELDDLLDGDQEEEYEYDHLPPFKPLRKSQIANLSKDQQKAYFDEYDYRVKLFQKKQWKQELRRLKEIKKRGESNQEDLGYHNLSDDDDQDTTAKDVTTPIPDWVLPHSFDSDNPTYRYRCLEPTSRLLTRPVSDPDGWDHDCGFDGVSLQHSVEVASRFPAAVGVQVNKDKKEFTIHLDSSIAAEHGKNGSTLAGFDIQTMMRQLAYTLRGEAKFKNLKRNRTTGGLSVTFFGGSMVTGAKLEDQLSICKRLTLVASTGAVHTKRDSAYAVSMEARLRDKDYPIGQALTTLGLSLVRWRTDLTLTANLKSQLSLGRSSNMVVHVDMNNKLTGQISIKMSTSEQLKIALWGVYVSIMYLLNKTQPCANSNY